jgi:molybdenum cofactor cytidylyltransferase
MGRPKLVLPIGGVPVIAHVVAALRNGGADLVLVVAPPREQPGAAELIDQAIRAGAEVVVLATPTRDMRATIEHGLDALERRRPVPDGVLLAPGDSPGLAPEHVAAVLEQFRTDPTFGVVPTHAGQRGHPLVIPWLLAKTIRTLPTGVGVNALLQTPSNRIVEIDLMDPRIRADLDTPEDYRTWAGVPRT